MRTLLLLLFLVVTAGVPLDAQAPAATEALAPEGTTIAAADVAGIAADQLTPDLRAAITALGGTPLQRARLHDLAARIEREKPDVVAAIRSEPLADGTVRVSFVVARIGDDPELLTNINSRYTIESVSVTGVMKTETLRQDVRDALQAMVGRRFDADEAERVRKQIAEHFSPLAGFEVTRRFERGSQPGQLRLIFETALNRSEEGGLLVMAGVPSQPRIVYHAYQGWSALFNFPIVAHHNELTFGLALSNQDDLIEEYSGLRVRFGRQSLGTDKLGASIEFSRYTQDWREATTLAAIEDPTVPGLYDRRRTIQPAITFRPVPAIRFRGAFTVSELRPLSGGDDTLVRFGSLGVSAGHFWSAAEGRGHYVNGAYEVQAASPKVDSDVDFTRHVVTGSYRFEHRRNQVIVSTMAGRARGAVPLFARFAFGDTNTLRGWNKFDVAPAGGTRAFHQTVEYRHSSLTLFVDAGSVWTEARPREMRYSTGGGFQNRFAFLLFGVPLNADDLRVTFMAGVKF